MTEERAAPRPPLSDWHTQMLRLTAFPSEVASIGEWPWWAELVGQPPETKVLQPRRGVQRYEGPFADGKLILNIKLGRIDWLFTAVEGPDMEAEGFSTVGALPDSLDTFRTLMIRWLELETSPAPIRLAFGCIVVQRVEDREAGYRQLATYLTSVQLAPEDSSDFLYQINRPRPSTSGIKGLQVNRLSKWSVAVLRSGMVAIRGRSADLMPGPECFACRLELDINTAADYQDELPSSGLVRVFEELVDLAMEIAQQGDVP